MKKPKSKQKSRIFAAVRSNKRISKQQPGGYRENYNIFLRLRQRQKEAILMSEKSLIEIVRDLSDEECMRLLEVIRALVSKKDGDAT